MAVQFFFKTRQTDDARWRAACAEACEIPGVKSKVSAKAGLFLIVPINALSLVTSLLKSTSFRSWAPPDEGSPLQFWPSLGHIPEVRWAEPGEVIAAQFGILFDNRRLISLMPWQKTEPLKFKKQSFLAQHPPGAGKSVTALLWALLETGSSILIVTTAKARLNWAREVKRYTKVEPELILGETPTSLRQLPRISITAFETLSAQVEALQVLAPITLIVDESHRAANRKRARMVPAEVEQIGRELPHDLNGKKPIFDTTTQLWIIPPPGAKQLDDGRWVKFEDRENLASSMAKLSRVARRRCLTTATPIKNRRVDLWAQLDYLDPWGFGSSSNWRRRYCGAAEIGYNSSLIDTGRTHTKELITRLNTLRSFVPVSITHKHLPRLRRDTFYVPIEAQNKSDFARAELKSAHAKGHAAGLEADLLDACSRKRRPVAAAIVEALGGSPPPDTKIVVFTGRRSDVGKLKDEIARAFLRFRLRIDAFGEVEEREPAQKQEEAAPPTIKIWASHGDDSAAVRHRYVEEYMAATGPAIFIGTRDAFGESIDLHSTDLVYMMMLPWTNGDILQNEYRFSRLGGTRPCLILYVIAEGTADEYVASIVIDKLPDMVEVGGHQELTNLREVLRGGKSETELRESLAAAILAGISSGTTSSPSGHDADRDPVVASALSQQPEYEELS